MALEPKKVGKAARKLRNFLKKNSRHVTPEEIHRLRTTIRKLEAAVDAVLPKPSRRERAILREIGRIRKRAGKIRDMDILTADAISMRGVKKEQEHLIELVHHLGAKRHKQAKRLRSLIQKKGQVFLRASNDSHLAFGAACPRHNRSAMLPEPKRPLRALFVFSLT